MLAALRRKVSKHKSVDDGAFPAATESEPLPAELWQLQLDRFAAQRAEHNRLFLDLLDEVDCGRRATQQRFFVVLDKIRVAFDTAQTRRNDERRASQKDLRDYEHKMQASCAALSDSSRDAAAREGLVRCEKRAENFRGAIRVVLQGVQALLSDWNGAYISGSVRVHPCEMGDEAMTYARFLDKLWAAIDAAPGIKFKPTLSKSTNSRPLNAESQTSMPHRSGPSTSDQSNSRVAQQYSPTDGELASLESIEITDDSGEATIIDAFSRLQAVRNVIWTRSSKAHSELLQELDSPVQDLMSDLAEAFLSYPCLNAADEDAAVLAGPTLVVAYRSAESKRELDLNRAWEEHRRCVRDSVNCINQDITTSWCDPGGPWSEDPVLIQRLRSSPRRTGQVHAVTFGPNILARRPSVMQSLPVVSTTKIQLDAFRKIHEVHEAEFARTLQKYRRGGKRTEAFRARQLVDALARWEAEAARAELVRNAEFTHALERIRVLHEQKIARNCSELAATLDREFMKSQQFREDAFDEALMNLHRDLLLVCKEFKHIWKAAFVQLRLNLVADDSKFEETSS
ncbi:hypothetical protein AURDEDRAFT_154843 [Auricularia subglabra TFB-10046 SS5]|uniref:Uncharacterized protein n=1 Tax=Auricularia subglabra (strain TFB-10046 / SS5) TaxID=717982 RepID=J0LF22_AURST|nr:hypothetical protein AURDEDRAFT_154843 [Auricularia subglabra TFB-10046 SS5]